MRQIKGIFILKIKSYLTLLLPILLLALGGCSQESGQNEASVSNGALSVPLPKALKALAVDETNLVVEVEVDGGARQACTNLVVDTVAGTYSCNLKLLAGSHSLTLVYSIIDLTYGTVQVATTSGINVNVVAGESTPADFSAAILSYDDGDGDGINNIDELDEGSDPAAKSYYIGGTVIGLFGAGAVIQLNGGNDLPLSSDGSFNILPAVADSSSYTVTVSIHPSSPNQTCTVVNGSGTVSGANVTDVQVKCSCVLDASLIDSCTIE